jgi:DNA replication protein DnaC
MSPTPTTPLPDPLQAHLSYLKLRFVQDNCEALAQRAAQEQWPHLRFLGQLLEGEVNLRKDHSTQRRICQARFPVLKSLQAFDFTWPTKINRPQIQNLFRLKFIADKISVVFLGNVGVGKTHLATALAYSACLAGHRVLYSTAAGIINHLTAAAKAGTFAHELRRFLKPALLVIDELGYLAIDKKGCEILFQVISQRYERAATIYTTNKAFKQWPSIFNNDSTITSAILDRVLHRGEAVVIEGRSFRTKDRIDPP